MPVWKEGMSDAVKAALTRRAARSGQKQLEIEWFIDQFSKRLDVTLVQRLQVATQFLRDRVVENISVPVVKEISKRTGHVVVTKRSRPGEFPRADTSTLRRTIFEDVRNDGGGWYRGMVGTPLGYGLELEMEMNRQFLTRTLREEQERITRILTGPIT